MEKKISVIVSVYNEEDNLNQFKKVTIPILDSLSTIDWIFEVLFVNDGSKDKSSEILDTFSKEDPRLKVIHFSRNFGHEAAMLAGIDAAVGDFLICMDADLQNPPDLIPEILNNI